MTQVVLGSASIGRLSVLRQAGVEPVVVVSGVDEDAILASLPPDATPADSVCALAAAKADDVATRLPADIAADCVVIGCDSMLYLDGVLSGKPHTPEAARSQWKTMAGRTGTLYTGHTVLLVQHGVTSGRQTQADATAVHFAEPTPAELDAYIGTGEPLKVAGAFTLDGIGGWFIDRIDGHPSNVIGLSLPTVRTLLLRIGIPIVTLWNTV